MVGVVPMIRRARQEESDALTSLALRSKAVWGYTDAFIERCRPVLTVTPEAIAEGRVFVAAIDGALAGVSVLRPREDGIELGMLFVEPAMLRRGIGAALLDHARAEARAAGYEALEIASDPDAEAFYLRRGAVRIGEVPSEVDAGRLLPLLSLPTEDAPTPAPGGSDDPAAPAAG
jgi:GNAT superfamily N-acetyltransferase